MVREVPSYFDRIEVRLPNDPASGFSNNHVETFEVQTEQYVRRDITPEDSDGATRRVEIMVSEAVTERFDLSLAEDAKSEAGIGSWEEWLSFKFGKGEE